jgi:hypothetical protein
MIIIENLIHITALNYQKIYDISTIPPQSSIRDLEKEKARMEGLAESMLKSSDEMAEKYINKKIDLEENIQNLKRRSKELGFQSEEIDRVIKELESKDLELEAVKLQEELSKITFEDK